MRALPSAYKALIQGIKTFDVGQAERDFREGDIAVFVETDITGKYTGRELTKTICYLSTKDQISGKVILGLST